MTSEAYSPKLRTRAGVPAATAAAWCGRGRPLPDGRRRELVLLRQRAPAARGRPAPFWIDRFPVSNGEFEQFIHDGGYRRREWWSNEGWEWRQRSRRRSRYWEPDGDGFRVRSLRPRRGDRPARPVCHVCWYEADAFARSRGKRLPSEAEWEKAASWDAAAGVKRLYPWGDRAHDDELANLDQLSFGTAQTGAYPAGAAPCGAEQMAGDVWEWTAGGFDAYPGFEAFPYGEYSEVFMGGPYRTLRGGAWATQAGAVTNSFRNWDHPDRRQLFAGFRCASDEEVTSTARRSVSGSADRARRCDDRRPPARGRADDDRGRRARRPVADTEAARAQVLLRPPRVTALRADHAPARVLPDARRAGDPGSSRRRDSRREQPRGAGGAGPRIGTQDTRAAEPMLEAAAGEVTYVPVDVSEARFATWRRGSPAPTRAFASTA